MRTSIIFIAIFLFFGQSPSLASEFRLADIEKFSEPLKLGKVMQEYPGWNHGHGPYIWYKSGEVIGKEIWFWFKLPKERRNTSLSEVRVTLITVVNSEDPDDLEIIWPRRYTKMDTNKVFESIYK
jgi:hypothetical protein